MPPGNHAQYTPVHSAIAESWAREAAKKAWFSLTQEDFPDTLPFLDYCNW